METKSRFLILETSGRVGHVGIAAGDQVLALAQLDEARRHARDLAPAVADLLARHHWDPRTVNAILVSQGPGSYTGLRVGIMSAKAFAYATGAALVAVETFAAVACQSMAETEYLDVIADAQQEKVYVQRFKRSRANQGWEPLSSLTIRLFADWLSSVDEKTSVTGPGLQGRTGQLPEGTQLIDLARWHPQPESILRIGLARYMAGERNDPWKLEPIYLRPSSAEEKWRGPTTDQ